jgi:hypothetical protein
MAEEPQPRQVRAASPEVVSQLHQMGELTADLLLNATLAGHEDALRVTDNDVRTRGGFVRWATPLRYLGDECKALGFTREHPGGLEMLVSPDKSFGIAVAPGNYATGTDRMPSTRIDRGPLTGQAVSGNRNQLRLDAGVRSIFGADPVASRKIWHLLSYFDKREQEIRVELSLPVEVTRKTDSDRVTVTHYEPRLVLPAIILAAHADVRDDDQDEDEIEIAVPRRT